MSEKISFAERRKLLAEAVNDLQRIGWLLEREVAQMLAAEKRFAERDAQRAARPNTKASR